MPNRRAWDLLYDFQIILGMARDLPPDSLRAAQALNTANTIVNVFRPGSDSSLEECLKIARQFLSAKNGDAQHEITALGHCHIGKLFISSGKLGTLTGTNRVLLSLDTGWLWPFEETIRKAARSWSSQIDLMDRYPDYKFICSQAQQYEWVKDNYPPLWERIKEKIALGQFMPTGGVSVVFCTG